MTGIKKFKNCTKLTLSGITIENYTVLKVILSDPSWKLLYLPDKYIFTTSLPTQ